MKPRYNETERLGVNAIENIILKEFKWIFREQPISDMGIDAQIERVENGNPTAEILGIQIKTGESHFQRRLDGLIYYGGKTHYEYWLNSSIPVLLVAHLPDENKTYWNLISRVTTELTDKGFKILIPFDKELNKDSIKEIKNIIKGPKELQRIRKLFYDKELMEFLDEGGRIFVETEDWHNKSLGRGKTKVILYNPNTDDENIIRDWFSYFLFPTVYNRIKQTFPWAKITIDEEYYDENFDESVYDIYPEEYIKANMKVYPYDIQCLEVSFYRLELFLGKVGEAFLTISDYLID